MPSTAIQTYSSNRLLPTLRPEKVTRISVALATGTYAKGTVLGEITATPGTYKAYASGNSDGSQTARGLLEYACTVDGSGNITSTGEWGMTQKAAPMISGGGGVFKTQDLTGLDAGAVTNLGGHLIEGTVSTGLLEF